MGEISVKTGNNARNGGKNSLNRLIRCVCGKKIGPDPRNFNQRVSLGRNDLLIRTFPNIWYLKAAVDHMIFNQMQEYFSPGYLRKMEQRSKKEFNQTYWWRPQDVTPE
ncbi:hypothetical protein [Klebsiella pneumoniae]|uniref:hypothetical protein n=1 Tax=Klebsiella pneumoniae TaxID=573 RepID=UPI0035D446F6